LALIIPPWAAQELTSVPRDVAKRLRERLERIAESPFAPQPGVKPMTGRPGVFRVRQGDWRAVYSVEDGDVIVERVGNRKAVYR
jgi:mRNA interferase RelE/StbE